jgi:ketosteroid isomerase-like protein
VTGQDGYRELMRCFQTGNLPGIRRLLDDELFFDNPAPPNALDTGDRRGPDEFMTFLEQTAASCEFEHHDMSKLLGEPDEFVAIGSERYRIRSTGKLVETPCLHEQRWRNGKLVFLREYYDTLAYEEACDP